MINPNRIYTVKELGTVTKIDDLNSPIPYIFVKTKTGDEYEGSIRRAYTKPETLRVGDRVKFGVQWSIVADKPMIRSLRRVLK